MRSARRRSSSVGSGCCFRKASAPWPNSFHTLRQLKVTARWGIGGATGKSGFAAGGTVALEFVESAVFMLRRGACRSLMVEARSAGAMGTRRPFACGGSARHPAPTRRSSVGRRIGPGTPLRFVGVDPGVGHVFHFLVVEVDLTGEKTQLLRVHGEVLGHVPGDGPFGLHAAPAVFPDFAMRLAAVVFLFVVAGRREVREIHP